MTRPWTLRIDPPADGVWNMALDQTLLDLAEHQGATTLRLYRWDPHTLSLGRNEPALKRYDRAAIEGRRIPAVRRPTGGRAVWHGRELTYAVTGPLELFGGLAGAYREIHHFLADALRRLGADPVLAPVPAHIVGLTAGACFATSAGGELMVADHKVVGSAQLTQGSAFLQHGSILLEDGQSLVGELASTRVQHRAADDMHLSALLGRTISFDAMACAVQESAISATGAPDNSPAIAALRPAAEHLARFADPGWTWRR